MGMRLFGVGLVKVKGLWGKYLVIGCRGME